MEGILKLMTFMLASFIEFKNLVLRDRRRSRFAGVRERRLCRSVVFKRSTGVVECWSIVQDSVFDGETRVPQNCHGQKFFATSQSVLRFVVRCFFNTPWPRPTTKV